MTDSYLDHLQRSRRGPNIHSVLDPISETTLGGQTLDDLPYTYGQRGGSSASEIKGIANIEKLNNSRNGNPRYRFTFDGGETMNTAPDARWVNSLAPDSLIGQPVIAHYYVTKTGLAVLKEITTVPGEERSYQKWESDNIRDNWRASARYDARNVREAREAHTHPIK